MKTKILVIALMLIGFISSAQKKPSEWSSATNEAIKTAIGLKDSTWIDGFVKGLGYWGLDSLTSVQGYLTIAASQVSDFDTEVSNNTSVSANTGKDTTGIHHTNRSVLDATTASFTTTLRADINANTATIADSIAFETTEISDNVIIAVGDTTVTAVLGRIVYKTSDNHFYGCISVTGLKWKQLDN